MSVLLPTAVVAVLVAMLAYQQRPKPGATWLTLLLLGVAWWAGFYAFELLVTDIATRRPLMKLQWLASAAIPVFWLLFALEYTGRDRYVTRRVVASLFVVPAAVLVLVFTFEHHELVYQQPVTVVQTEGGYVVDKAFGPAFYASAAYSFACSLVGSAVLIPMLVERRATHREQSTALLVAILAPWVGHAIYLFDVDFLGGIDPTPMALLVSGIAAYVALSRLELFEAMPVPDHIAREFVVDGMDDPVVVVDTRGRIVDVNSAASTVIGLPSQTVTGLDAIETVPGYHENSTESDTVTVETAHGVQYFDIKTSTITDAHDRELGTVVTMRDVTEREQDEQRLTVLNRVLRHNLRNEMNVVSGCAEELATRVGEDDVELATTIADTAHEVASLGDTARQIERLLDESEDAPIVDLREAVDVLLTRAESEYPTATFSVEWTVPEAVEVRQTIEPVLWHLLQHGAAHDDANVRVFVATDGGGYVSVTVADDGPPIPRAERAVLQTGTETPLDHASGLGLWLVVWGVRAMGGTVDFESHADTGNAVTVHVPATSTPQATRQRADVS
ncbi:histidine kinase N-terminal 7TM domain-containing protein [Haloarchaeobius sp. DFWS5]|uniref:histidine kinase N-terminal 7TM domain-containing protein n=1 Tax=Haloarchaeobius sp. DFWS5 TaxID=3446114 RepID=UPI003EBC2AD9